MTNKFDDAFEWLMVEEGGYSNNPKDRGGATNYGISLRYLKTQKIIDGDLDGDGDIDWQDILLLTKDLAKKVVLEDWWTPNHYGDFSPAIGRKLLSLSYNMGTKSAHRLIQQAVRACNDRERLSIDGVLGKHTRVAILCQPPEALLAALKSEAAGYYRCLVARRPDQAEFINGWLNRAYH